MRAILVMGRQQTVRPRRVFQEVHMTRRRLSLSLSSFVLAVAPAVLVAASLMMATATTIDVPTPGEDVPLSGLRYKALQFEAKITSVRLEIHSEADADPVLADWSFQGSNSDGQMHRIELQLRMLDASGKQVAMPSHYFTVNPGAHDQVIKFETKLKAADWKATSKVKIVVNWVN
jgi:hypothetical protein